MGVLLITHDLRLAFGTCDRVHVFYAGSLLEVASSADLEHEPLHPYSHGLLLSEPPADRKLREMLSIPGSVPAPDDVAGGCAFAPRCRWATAVCTESTPALVSVGNDRWSRCLRLADIRDEMAEIRARVEIGVDEVPAPDDPTRSAGPGREVVKQFDNGKEGVRAVDGVSIKSGPGRAWASWVSPAVGRPRWRGCSSGLETASGGEIEIDGVAATDWSAMSRRDARRLRSTVQMVFQDPYSSLNPMRTIGWTLQEAIRTHDPKASDIPAQVVEPARDGRSARQLRPTEAGGPLWR